MSLGDVVTIDGKYWLQLGELPSEPDAPLVLLTYADDDQARVAYSCDERFNRYFILPQGVGRFPPHGMFANFESANLVPIAQIVGGIKIAAISTTIMELIHNCARRKAKQKIKKYLTL